MTAEISEGISAVFYCKTIYACDYHAYMGKENSYMSRRFLVYTLLAMAVMGSFYVAASDASASSQGGTSRSVPASAQAPETPPIPALRPIRPISPTSQPSLQPLPRLDSPQAMPEPPSLRPYQLVASPPLPTIPKLRPIRPIPPTSRPAPPPLPRPDPPQPAPKPPSLSPEQPMPSPPPAVIPKPRPIRPIPPPRPVPRR